MKTQLYEPNPENVDWFQSGLYNRLHDDIFEFAYAAFTDDAFMELDNFSESLGDEDITTHAITLLRKFSDMVSRERTA